MKTNTSASPVENALDSLNRVALNLHEKSLDDVLTLKGALVWGWHVVDILAYLRLQPERKNFDAWMQDYLNEGEPTLNVDRDAHWDQGRHLSILELLDIFSETDLEILKPDFYQGWTDRTSRCQELRNHVSSIVGGSLNAGQREQLLKLLAVYNRLFHLPVGISLEAAPMWDIFPALFDFIELLFDKSIPEADRFLTELNDCRASLENNK